MEEREWFRPALLLRASVAAEAGRKGIVAVMGRYCKAANDEKCTMGLDGM